MYFAVIPAAGRSRRMGQPKLLLPWRDATVIEQVIAAWRAGRVDHVVAVVRGDDQPLARLCRAAGAEVVEATPPPPEMKDSVLCALADIRRRYAPTTADAWLLAPADMPQLSPQVVERLLSAHAADANSGAILVPTFDGRRGHPVLFPWPLAEEVARLADDEGVNSLLGRCAVREIPCADSGILGDLDTPEDYRRLRDR